MTCSADLLIIGAGPAGLAAALAAHEDGIENIVILEREKEPGGILRQCIHNGFGLHRYKEELTGPEYAQRDIEKCISAGIKIYCGTTVLSLSSDLSVTSVSESDGYRKYQAKAVILAMGCRERPRGALCTPGTRCAGIYTAGTAQNFVNLKGYMPGRNVVILGSGDIGLIMARRMTLQGAKVLACVEIMPYSSGLARNIVQCLDDYHIPLFLNHTVTEIMGRDRLTGVKISKVDENRHPVPGTDMLFECDTLLLSCGLIPENELSIKAGVQISPVTSGAYVDDTCETSVPGVFACGNVLHVHDLVDHVSEESFKAGHSAAQYILGRKKASEMIRIIDGDGVRGTVPQFVGVNPDAPVSFMFRPGKVYRNAIISFTCAEKEIFRKKVKILTPGEMASVTLAQDLFKKISGNAITVSIKKEDE